MRRVLPLLLVLAFGCGATATTRPHGIAPSPTVVGPAAGVSDISEQLLTNLSLLATDTVPLPNQLAADLEAIERRALTLEQYVDRLVSSTAFDMNVAPGILLKSAPYVPQPTVFSGMYTLGKIPAAEGGRPVHYIAKTMYRTAKRKPCDPHTAVSVHPWWAPASEILVCPDAYQPEHLVDPHGWRCGGSNLALLIAEAPPKTSMFCGCGPHLVNCFPDEARRDHVVQSVRKEVQATVAHVVRSGLPIERTLTMNETVRDRDAEFMYLRWRVLSGDRVDVSEFARFSEVPVLATRTEMKAGQHAGVLTAPQMVYGADAPRARLRNYYDELWCSGIKSTNVTAEQVLALGATDLREGEGWRKLAAMPVCTDCHARLDYGMQFFRGYGSTFVTAGYLPKDSPGGDGPLYGDDIHDQRGTAHLDPRSFAELVAKQADFGNCMVSRVVSRTLDSSASTSEKERLAAEFDRHHDLRELVKAALLMAAARWTEVVSNSSATSGGHARVRAHGKDGTIAVLPALREGLVTHCGECHGGGSHDFLRGLIAGDTALPQQVARRMLEEVAFGSMPKGAMDDAPRAAMVAELVDSLWPDDDEQRIVAMTHFARAARSMSVYGSYAVRNVVAARAGVKADVVPVLPGGNRYSSTFALTLLQEGLQACEAAGNVGPALVECLERATAPESVVTVPVLPSSQAATPYHP